MSIITKLFLAGVLCSGLQGGTRSRKKTAGADGRGVGGGTLTWTPAVPSGGGGSHQAAHGHLSSKTGKHVFSSLGKMEQKNLGEPPAER